MLIHVSDMMRRRRRIRRRRNKMIHVSEMMRRRRIRINYHENESCRWPVGKNPSQELSGKTHIHKNVGESKQN